MLKILNIDSSSYCTDEQMTMSFSFELLPNSISARADFEKLQSYYISQNYKELFKYLAKCVE